MPTFTKVSTPFFLFLITILGTLLRIANLSPFKVYPDSYQSLVVAHNISTYHSVLGTLGQQGMLYPNFVMWTRPGYPLLINSTAWITNPAAAAQAIALVAGVLSIPLAFLLIKTVCDGLGKRQSTIIGFIGAFLLAISFNHAVWGGFIMTESLGTFLMLLFLSFLFQGNQQEVPLGNPKDLLTGSIFACAVLTRYEYAIMLFPLLFLIFSQNPHPVRKSITILTSFLCILTIVATLFFPVKETFLVLTTQSNALLLRAGLVLGFFFIIAVAYKMLPTSYSHRVRRLLSQLFIGCIWIFSLLIVAQLLLPQLPFHHELTFLRSFSTHDFVLIMGALIGLTIFLKTDKQQPLGFFVLFSVISLSLFYQRVNPAMERYATHLIPFLIIPASFAVFYLMNKNRWTLVPIMLLVIVQTIITSDGMRHWKDSSWYRPSYEEKAAVMVQPFIKKDDIIIASFPESYYFFLGNSTYSITDSLPFIYIDPALDQRQTTVIVDMAMHDLFPRFTNFMEIHFAKEKTKPIWVNETYHYSNRSLKETHPIVLYQTTIGELKKRIKNEHHIPNL